MTLNDSQPYDGDVQVAGPAQTRDLGVLRLTKVAVGDYANNCYLLECTATGGLLLVDAASEPETLLALIGDRRLSAVLTTHQHRDHWQALGEVVRRTGATTLAHPIDAEGIPVPTDITVDDGATVQVGHVALTAMHLSGHTPGSIALAVRDSGGRAHIITGDCLFPGGVGRTTSPEQFDSLYDGIVSKIFDAYADDTWIYPGHGRDTTLGVERPALAEWRERGW